MKSLAALSAGLMMCSVADADPTVEYLVESCAAASALKAKMGICHVTSLSTTEIYYEITVGVGAFGDTQVVGVGYEVSGALVAKVKIPVSEARSADEAKQMAVQAVLGGAPAKSVLNATPQMCVASSSKYAEALAFIETLNQAARVPENQCRPKT